MYDYNNTGKINSVKVKIGATTKNVATSISYKTFGPATGWTYGNGSVRSLSYDLDYRLTGIDTAGKQDLQFDYDNANNITNNQNSNYSQSLTYTDVYQLEGAVSNTDNQSYSYDGVGNRLTNNTTTYSYFNNNRIKYAGSNGYQYDNKGNVTSFNGKTYTYGVDNRMLEAVNSGVTTQYQYNALGQRVAKTVNGQAEHFVYSVTGQLLAEPTSNKEYIYYYGQPVGYVSNNTLYYIHNDQLGRPELMTNASDSVVWRANLKSFERTVQTSSIGDFNIGFPGQYWDEEKGCYYNMFRDYDPETGRYLQSDPIGLAGRMNTYAYVGGNHVSYVDPDGLIGVQAGMCALMAVAQGGVGLYNELSEKGNYDSSGCDGNTSKSKGAGDIAANLVKNMAGGCAFGALASLGLVGTFTQASQVAVGPIGAILRTTVGSFADAFVTIGLGGVFD